MASKVNRKKYLTMLEQATTLIFPITIGSLTFFVPVDKQTVVDEVTSWDTLDPVEVGWHNNDAETHTLIHYDNWTLR